MIWTADTVIYRGVSMDAAYSGDTLVWKKDNNDYFTLKVVSSGTISFNFNTKNTEMSINNGEYTIIGTRTENFNTGDTIKLRGTEQNYTSMNGYFYGTAKFKAMGNILSLVYGDDYDGKTTAHQFSRFFKDCTSLVDANELILPSTSVFNSGYQSMFYNCTSLLSAPELPATTLDYMSYEAMFDGCSSLINPPSVLPATTLPINCYQNMFTDCTSLTDSPLLPAATLNQLSYARMFYNCTSLNNITCLATDISAIDCLTVWVYGVNQTGTFVKASGSTWTTGDNGIPEGWTVVEQ